MRFQLDFPSKDELISNKKTTIFTVYKDVYCRVTYGEDDNDGFFLDLMCDGYSDHFWNRPKYYDNTDKGYFMMEKDAENLFNEILNNMLKENN